MTLRDLYPLKPGDRRTDPVVATYSYVDEDGNLLYQVQRTVNKRFMQRRPDPQAPSKWVYNLDGTRRVLYRLPLVIQAVREGQRVWVVEGEKDVHTLESLGQVATCNPGGAGKWRDEYAEALRGAHVTVVADRDKQGANGKIAGIDHARVVARSLLAAGCMVDLVGPAIGKDITDHVTAGVALDETLFVPIDGGISPSQAAGGQAEPIGDTPENGGPAPVYVPEEAVGKRLRHIPASHFDMKAAKWVWQDRMPRGEICLIAGREGIGKSTFLAWLAAQITRGTLPGEYYGQPRAVLYSAAEDSWSYTIVPRMHAAGADLDLVYRVDVEQPELGTVEKLILPNHVSLLPDTARDLKAAILMCDPIVSNLSEKLNPNHARELRMALEPLRDAAEKAGIAVAGLAHFNKTRDTDASSMITGSRAWVEVSRAVLAIAQDDRAESGQGVVQVVSQIKNNLGRLDLPSMEYQIANHEITLDNGEDIKVGRLEWLEGASLTHAEEILQRRPGPRPDRSGMARTTAAVLDFLDDQPMAVSPRQIADALPNIVNHANARQLLNRLAARGEIERVGTGLYQAVGLSQSPRAREHAHAPTRAGGPPAVTSHHTHKIRGGGGSDVVTAVTCDSDSRGGRGGGVTAAVGSIGSCRLCHGPMEIVYEGQTVHPLCEEQV
jgi:hypothetical protein